jgi:hypothetical protein
LDGRMYRLVVGGLCCEAQGKSEVKHRR